MDKPVRFFECLLPVTVCNLKCPYCYVIQENRRTLEYSHLQFSPQHIAKALRRERVGGICWISICGAGETLAQPEITDIVYYLLVEGHYINITTNGTLSNRLVEMMDKCKPYSQRIHFSFSFHYTELLRRNLIDVFFDNIDYVRKMGASFLFQINLCDEYIPYIDDIKKISLKRVGAFPQVALTRDESVNPMKIFSNLDNKEYYDIGKSFGSELFEFTYSNFNVRRMEFCYAGDWSFVLNLQTGILDKCYCNRSGQNIFEDIDSPIIFEAVGNNCNNSYCVNSSHFLSLGVIPELITPSYAQLRCRKGDDWYSKEMYCFLNSKLSESHKEYSAFKKWKKYSNRVCFNRIKSMVNKLSYIIERKNEKIS